MGLFSKKKLSFDEILSGIDALSEEERLQLIAKLQPQEEQSQEKVEETTVEENEPTEETSETEEPVTEEAPPAEPSEPVDEPSEDAEAEPVAEEETEVVDPAPTETPAPETVEQTEQPEEAQTMNYDEVITAQAARIESLESQLSALKETVEKIVANQDNQNFGHSPHADFDDDVQLSRRDAIMQAYAPRRAEQYK